MIYGILLVYYEEKHQRAIDAFKDLFASLQEDRRVLIVNNNPALTCQDSLPGSNDNQEFSGWDTALHGLVLRDADTVILANDTFLDGGKWDAHCQRRFRSRLRKFVSVQPQYAMCGEVVPFPGGYDLLGCHSDRWVRTHIFGLRGDLLKRLGQISLSASDLHSAVQDIVDNKFVWGEAVGPSLRRRIDSWLTPSSNESGWRKQKMASSDRKLKKARAILNEKWLSAFCVSNGYRILDCGPGSHRRVLSRIRAKCSQFANPAGSNYSGS
jgi:hypothetical protein